MNTSKVPETTVVKHSALLAPFEAFISSFASKTIQSELREIYKEAKVASLPEENIRKSIARMNRVSKDYKSCETFRAFHAGNDWKRQRLSIENASK